MVCKGRCYSEKKPAVDFRKTHLQDEIIYKRCSTCGYSKQTNLARCYCCNYTYRTKPHGASRKDTREMIMAAPNAKWGRI